MIKIEVSKKTFSVLRWEKNTARESLGARILSIRRKEDPR